MNTKAAIYDESFANQNNYALKMFSNVYDYKTDWNCLETLHTVITLVIIDHY